MTVEINGEPAGADDLEQLVANGYGCFTSMQVRGGQVHGLALHLRRLEDDGAELFGAVPREILPWVRQATTGRRDCSVRVTLLCLDVPALVSGGPVVPDVVVEVGPPRESSTAPLRVRTVRHQRETPWIKHRATYGLTREVRAARQAGYDDAALVDRDGNLAEGTFWNVCVHDGRSWVFAEADVLDGVTQRLVQAAMTAAGTPFTTRPLRPEQAADWDAAFAMNATSPLRPITAIDQTAVRSDPGRVAELTRCWASVAPEAL